MKLHEQLSSVGSPAIRLDGRPKVTGTTRYTADHVLSGMIWGKCLRTPFLMLESVALTTKSKEKKESSRYLPLAAKKANLVVSSLGWSGCRENSGRSLQCGAEAARRFREIIEVTSGEALISRLCLKCHGAPVVLPKSTGLKGPRRLVMLFTNQCRRVFYYVARPPLLADFLHTRFVHRGPDPHFFIKLDGARMIGDRKVR
jgi:hypothetical protein